MSTTSDERRRRAMIDARCTCTCPACGHVGPWHGECESCGHDRHETPDPLPPLAYRTTTPDDVIIVCARCVSHAAPDERGRYPGDPLDLDDLEGGASVTCDGCGSTVYGGTS